MAAAEPAQRRRFVTGRAVDVAIVGSLLIADLSAQAVATAGGRATSPALGFGPVVLAALCAGLFWWRRRAPLTVLVAVLVAVIVSSVAFPPGLLSEHTGVPVALAAYGVGSWSARRVWAAVLPVAVLGLMFAALAAHAAMVTAAAVALVVVALPWVAGQAARSRRLYLEEVEGRLAEAERERDRRAERAVLDERRHLARELHDVVAHHVSLIGVQAGAARTALDRSPERTRDALMAIERSSRSAVGEMRHLLDVLRAEGGAGELEPQPGLSRLDELVGSFRGAGLQVGVRVAGDPGRLSPLVDLCCYRLVEEALTNAARHSAGGAAFVDVVVGPPDSPDGHPDRGAAGGRAVPVRILVRDPGPSRTGRTGTGHGLVGLRERVALFHGTLSAGPTADGGFAVDAVLCDRGTP